MSANIVICPLCNELATVVDMTPAPRFAWCEACKALHVPQKPKKPTSKSPPPSKKSKAPEPEES